MFKIISSPRAWWGVSFLGVEEDGKVITNTIEMRFHIHDEDTHRSIMADAALLGVMEADLEVATLSEKAAAFVLKIADDWRGVGAENGEPLPWTPENLRRLLNVPNVIGAVLSAYVACRAGAGEIRAGN